MPDLHTFVNQMNGGEMSPQMDGRVDIEKYQTGARVLENFIVRPYGGIYKRPGTDFISNTYQYRYGRLLPFESPEGSYQLEFTVSEDNFSGNGNLRIWDTYNIDYGSINDDFVTVVKYDLTTDVTHPTNIVDNYYSTWASYDYTTGTSLTAGWTSGVNFTSGQGIFFNDNLFIATANHTSELSTAPASGSDWSDYWTEFTYDVGNVVYWTDGAGYRGYKALEPTSQFLSSEALMIANSGIWENLPSFPDVNFNTPYKTTDDLSKIQICAINDVVFVAHPDYPPKKLTKLTNTKWTFEDVEWDFAPTLDVNDTTNILQLQFDEPYWADNTSYFIGNRVTVLDSLSNTFIYTCNTAHVSNSASNNTGIPGRATNWKDYWNYGTSKSKYRLWAKSINYKVGQEVVYKNVLYTCIKDHLSFLTISDNGIDLGGDNEPTTGKKWTTYWKNVKSLTNIRNVKTILNSSEDFFTSSSVGETFQLNITPEKYYLKVFLNGDANTELNLSESDYLFIQGSYLVLSNWNVREAPKGIYVLEESLDKQTWTVAQQWLVDSISDSNINYTGEAPSTGAWYRFTGTRSSASTGIVRLTLEPLDFTLKLPFKVTSVVNSKTAKGVLKLFNDQMLPAAIIGKETASYNRAAFSERTGYPSSVAFHENRLWWGGVETQPGRIWASQKDDYYIYLIGTKATDALDITLQSTTTSRILWLKSYNKSLVVATAIEIFTVDAGESDAQISSTNIRARARASIGSASIPGVVTADSLLYFQNGKRKLRELSYNFSRDAWDTPDMTIYAEHIGQDSFVEASYMNSPEPVLWCISQNGALMGFSYDRSQNIIAWHRHITGDRNSFYGVSGANPDAAGRFRSVSVVNGDFNRADEVWFIVGRSGGYCIERFNPGMLNFIYGDSGNTYAFNADDFWRFSDCGLKMNYRDTSLENPTRTYYYKPSNVTSISTNYRDIPASGRKVYNFTTSLSSGDVNTGIAQLSSAYGLVFNGTIPEYITYNSNTFTSLVPTLGIPIFAVYVPNRFEVQLQNGTSQGRKISINRMMFRNWKSDGGKFNVYNAFQTSLMDGVTALEMKPSPNDSYTNINYSNYNFNVQTSRQNTPEYLYSGQTDDQVINMSWSENPLIAIVHEDQTPFNLLGIVYKYQVQGN